MKIWSSSNLNLALGCNTNASGNVLHFNSSDLSEGDIFIALGKGHDYINHALEMGASVIIAETIADTNIDLDKIIIVPSCEDALEKMAIFKRNRSKAKFIAVTGSAGKTSTKEIIYNILKHFSKAFVSRGNFNNHLGVRLNLASMPEDINYAVFEMGMNNAGEIKPLASIVKPDIGIITNILEAHLGHFNSTLGIAKEKSDIFSMMDSKNGIALLNKDDNHYMDCCKYSKLTNIYSFGANNNADSILKEYKSDGYESDLLFSVLEEDVKIKTKITGKHHASNIASILLLFKILGLDLQKVASYFKDLTLIKGRGEKINIKISGHDCILINDSYNSSPSALKHSLISLKEIDHSHKIAILGDMKELGHREIEYHTELAPVLIDSGIKSLYTVGPLMHHLHKILKDQIDAQHFESSLDLQSHITNLITHDSIILIKGSNSMRLMDLANFLTSHK